MAAREMNRASILSVVRRVAEILLSQGVLPILLVGLFLAFGLYEERFWKAANLFNVLRNASYLMIISAGQMMVLIIGGFDLSVGAVAALTSVTAAMTMAGLYTSMPEAVAMVTLIGVLAGLAAGTAIGALNGITVAVLRVNPFMVTLGAMSIAYGIAFYTTTGVPVYGMPEEFTRGFGRARWIGLPVTIFLTLGILVVIWWLLNWTKYGRYVYAIGSNQHAARVSGVPLARCIIATYTACAFLAAVTGILLTARVGSGEANLARTITLECIAAALIGGVSLRGGVGKVQLVALGALFLSMVTNGMNLVRIDSKLQTIVIGVVLILAVGLDRLKLSAART